MAEGKKGRSRSKCSRSKYITVRRKRFTRHTASGKAVTVPASTYKVYRGRGCKVAYGAKGPGALHGHERAWIQHKGKLGGPGYVHKSAAERHRLLSACVRGHGYRSCLGSVMVLERNGSIRRKYGPTLAADRHFLEQHYGGHRHGGYVLPSQEQMREHRTRPLAGINSLPSQSRWEPITAGCGAPCPDVLRTNYSVHPDAYAARQWPTVHVHADANGRWHPTAGFVSARRSPLNPESIARLAGTHRLETAPIRIYQNE